MLHAVEPIKVFYSYAHEDEPLRKALEQHLSPLKHQGIITDWHDRMILPGTEWGHVIDQHLASAQLIILLISPAFMASDYCFDIEMTRAMEQHERGEARVIPVILRPVLWEPAPFGKLQCLPPNKLPVTSWPDRDEAYLKIAQGIQQAAEELRQALPQRTDTARLLFRQGGMVKVMRLFAHSPIVLGRPMLSAALWLTLFPLEDPDNQRLMDGISERHATLYWGEYVEIRDHSKAGTKVNDKPVSTDGYLLQDGDLLSFRRDALQLRVHLSPGQWLRLERVNNAPDAENYLLLRASAVIGTGTEAGILVAQSASSGSRNLAILQYSNDGFVILPRTVSMTVNGEPVPADRKVGLWKDDRIQIGGVIMEFDSGAYPEQEP